MKNMNFTSWEYDSTICLNSQMLSNLFFFLGSPQSCLFSYLKIGRKAV